jgi:hypothetical protein
MNWSGHKGLWNSKKVYRSLRELCENATYNYTKIPDPRKQNVFIYIQIGASEERDCDRGS